MNTTTETPVKQARLSPGRQWIGIRNLEFIEEVQPRAGLDRGWVNDLSKFRLEGSEFPPIWVFQTPDGRLIPGEGHHRSMAMASAGEDQILCDVVDGTMEDAIVYAAGSNRSNGVKPMGPKDITKALDMLFAIETWWGKSDTTIAGYVGCSAGKVKTARARFSVQNDKPLPDLVENIAGARGPYRYAGKIGEPRICRHKTTRGQVYRACYKGKRISGATPDIVKEKIAREEESNPRRLSLSGAATFFKGNGFVAATGYNYRGIAGYWRPGFVCIPCDFSSNLALPLAIGQLIAARRHKEPTARSVVVCYVEDGCRKLVDLYRQEGFEFLMPQELIVAIESQ